MAIGYSRYLNAIYVLGDILILNLSFAVVRFLSNNYSLNADNIYLAQFLYINFFWLLTVFIFKTNEFERVTRYEQVLGNLLKTVVVHCLLLVFFKYLLSDYIFPIQDFPQKYLLFVFLLIVWRTFMLILISFVRRRGLNYRRVVIVGGDKLASDIQNFFVSHPEVGYRLQGIFSDNVTHSFTGKTLGNVNALKEFAVANATDEIYCSISGMSNEKISELILFCDQNLIRFKLIPDFGGLMNRRVQIDFYDAVPVLTLRSEPLESLMNRIVKRVFDILFSLLIIVLIFPWLMLIIAFFIKLSSNGPVFFKQKRSGKNNKEFTCLKFRTMKVNSEADEVQATKNDSRITGIGKILRKTNLDELPQFFNVFIGQMSVVGPRPHMLKHTSDYSKMIDKFMVRHFIQPGITGWAQVNGYRGETIQTEKMEKRVEYDVWYIENWSLFLDIKIIAMTILNMAGGEENAG